MFVETETWLVYHTDDHHSYKSRDLIGVGENKAIAIRLILDHAKNKNGKKINKTQLANLKQLKQTQRYKGNGEYVIEKVIKNRLL